MGVPKGSKTEFGWEVIVSRVQEEAEHIEERTLSENKTWVSVWPTSNHPQISFFLSLK